jgi:hypothetical protein
MNVQIARLIAATAVVAALAIPAAAIAADPDPAGPPPAVVDWQVHLDHMRSMEGTLGNHVAACAEAHGSMSGMLGPNGSMAGMMDGGMMR